MAPVAAIHGRDSLVLGETARSRKPLRMTDRADRVIAHYERYALSWDVDRRTATWYDKSWIDRFIALLPAGSSVLDVGCGGGRPVASAMVTAGIKVTGVDTSPSLLALCRNRMPDQEWVRSDMRELTLGRQFDGVLAWDSFFHLKHDDQRAMFPIFATHAERGAILMYNAGLAHGEATGCYRGDPLYHASLSDAEYKSLLDATGFELLEHAAGDPTKGGRIVWIARKRYSAGITAHTRRRN